MEKKEREFAINFASSIGTPIFYNMLGDILLEEFKSEKILIVRGKENRWEILDAKNYYPKKMLYSSMEELLEELEDFKVAPFPFNTYVFYDGEKPDMISLKSISKLFEKDGEYISKLKYEEIINSLSYQLSVIEKFMIGFTGVNDVNEFIEFTQSGISEMLTSTVGTFELSEKDNTLKLISKIGNLYVPEELKLSKAMKDYYNLPYVIYTHELSTVDKDELMSIKARALMMYDFKDKKVIMVVFSEDLIKESERLFVETIYKISKHYLSEIETKSS